LSRSSVERPAPAWRCVAADGSLTLALHVQPNAKRSEVTGVRGDAVRIRLAAPAVEGKANVALISLLADAFGVPERAVRLIRGAKGRRKIVHIAAPMQRPDRAWGE